MGKANFDLLLIGGGFNAIKRSFSSGRIISIGEQGILSGVNFFATILLARTLAIDAFGAYALALTTLTLLKGFHKAIISIPLVVLCPTAEDLHPLSRYWHVVQLAVVALPVSLCFLIYLMLHEYVWAQNVSLSLALMLFTFYHEFYRRWLIQEEKIFWLLPMAVAYAAVFLFVLFFFMETGSAVVGAFGMMSGASVASIIGYFASSKHGASKSLNNRDDLFFARLWRLGRWQILSHLAYVGYNSLVPVIVSGFTGPAGIAIMNATQNIGKPIQTFIMAIDSVDKPRASAALRRFGVRSMISSLKNTTRTIVLPGGIYLILVGIFAKPILHFLFAGKYDNSVIELRLWLPIFLLMMFVQPRESGLYLLKRADILFSCRVWASISGVITALLLIPLIGVKGALLALLVGWSVSYALSTLRLNRILSFSNDVAE